ncbi:MAG: TonB-dependent receptor domain-containing protein, partial [Terriglobia bacterium]
TVTNAACPQLGATQSVTLSPITAPIINTIYPSPNLPGAQGTVPQFTYPYTQPTREDYGQLRVDHNFSANDSLFVRYTIDDAAKIGTANYPQWREPRRSRSQFGTLSETHIFSPTVLNTFRFSYSRTLLDQKTDSGVIGPQFSFVEGQDLSQFAVTGLTAFSGDNASPSLGKQNIFTGSDDAFYTRGNHAFKFGTLLNRFQQYTKISLQTRGNITFASIRDLMQGTVQTFTRLTAGGRQERYIEYSSLGFYAQDDWRVRPNLTLNLGLRYEFITIPQEGMNPSLGSAVRDIRLDTQATLGRALFGENPSLKNFSPRFGFAWDVRGDGRTAVRGGFGLLYDLNNHIGTSLLSLAGGTPPFSTLSSISNFSLTQCCPIPVPSDVVGKSVRLFDYNLQQPHILHYNLTVQRQLPWDAALTLAYAGSRGLNLVRHVDANPTTPQTSSDGRRFWTGNEPRTNPAFDYIRFNTASGDSWYNSFQFGLQKRLSEGLQFQSSYTWSKSIDTTQGVVPADSSGDISPVDALDNRTDKGPSAFDLLHNWRFNAIYRIPGLPTQGLVGKVLGGWWVSGILSYQQGYPFSVGLQRNRSRSKYNDNGGDRPDLVAGAKTDEIITGVSRGCGNPGTPAYLAPGAPIQAPERYFDPCAFSIQDAGFLGTAGRNILRGPGRTSVDFSLAKDTPLGILGESGKLEFRAEFFNILNHVNFDMPSMTAFTGAASVENPVGTAGRITGAGTSRQVQLSLKVLF